MTGSDAACWAVWSKVTQRKQAVFDDKYVIPGSLCLELSAGPSLPVFATKTFVLKGDNMW